MALFVCRGPFFRYRPAGSLGRNKKAKMNIGAARSSVRYPPNQMSDADRPPRKLMMMPPALMKDV